MLSKAVPLSPPRYFIKFDKIWPFYDFSAPPREASIWGEGQPDGVGSVQDGVKGDAGCGGNAVQGFGLDKGIEGSGLVPVEVGRRTRPISGPARL
jgi:hypothetical protein